VEEGTRGKGAFGTGALCLHHAFGPSGDARARLVSVADGVSVDRVHHIACQGLSGKCADVAAVAAAAANLGEHAGRDRERLCGLAGRNWERLRRFDPTRRR